MPHKKANLPTKVCPVCQRPFSWRKKWAKIWEEVKYCSDRCRSHRHALTLADGKHPDKQDRQTP